MDSTGMSKKWCRNFYKNFSDHPVCAINKMPRRRLGAAAGVVRYYGKTEPQMAVTDTLRFRNRLLKNHNS